MATGTLLDVPHLLFEPVVTVGAAVFTYSMARPVSLRPRLWAFGAVVIAFSVHRAVEALIPDPELFRASIGGDMTLLYVMLEYAGSAIVFLATPWVVWGLTRHRRPILDGERS